MIPAISNSLPFPQTPWNFSHDLFHRVRSQPENDKQFKTYEVLNTDPEFNFILKYFEHQKPPGYGIKRIVCIHNPDQTAAFEIGLKNIEREVENPIFAPKWSSEPLSEQRSEVIARWKQLTQQFSPLTLTSRGLITKAKVLPLWHGTNKLKCESICSSGFTFFGKHHSSEEDSTDKRYFGSGIYFTTSARYSALCSPDGIILLNWVSMREPYPVVSDIDSSECSDVIKLEGKEHYQNYNTHYIPVIKNSKSMEYSPCHKGQIPVWDEFVVFEKFQTLPRFWIELGVDLPTPIPGIWNKAIIHKDKINAPASPTTATKPFENTEVRCFATLEEHKAPVSALVSFTNGLIASGSWDKTIKLWDSSQGKSLKTLEGHKGMVYALVSIDNNLLASGSSDKTVKVWDLSKGKCHKTLDGHKGDVNTLALLENTLASGSNDKTIRIWDLSKGKCTKTLEGHDHWILTLATINKNLLVSGSYDSIVKLWDPSQNKCLTTLPGHKDSVSALTPLSNDLFASGSCDKTIKVWDITQGKCLKTLEGHKDPISSLIQLTNGLLASGSRDKTVKLWDPSSGKCLKTLEGHTNLVNTLTSIKNGLFASGSHDNTIKLWK